MRYLLYVLFTVFFFAQTVNAAGLGGTTSDLEKRFNRGYRQEFPIGDAMARVQIGIDDRCYVEYIKDPEYRRVDRITGPGGALMLFCGENPSFYEFIEAVKELIPRDARLVSAFRESSSNVTDTYNFKSAALAKSPGIKKASAHQGVLGIKGDPVGTFKLRVDRDIKNKERVAVFSLALGIYERPDHAISIKGNPFK
jgi:hypothetical protein